MRLELQKIKFKNFLSFGASWHEVDFLPGVNVVLGLDENTGKSNGSGKTSFLETIPFGLFGKVHRDVKKEEIINWKNRKACEVQLSFKKGDRQYKIIRGIKPDKFEIYKDNELIPRPSHVRDYQKTLEEIIGLNYQTFMSLIHSNLNSSKPILSMGKPEKRKFMEKIFGLELYTRLNDKCNSKIKVIKDKITEGSITLNYGIDTINETKRRMGDLRSNLQSFRSSQIRLNEAREVLKQVEGNVDDLSEQLSSIKRVIVENESEIYYHMNIVRNIRSKREVLNVKIKNIIKILEQVELDRERYETYIKKKDNLEYMLKVHQGIDEEIESKKGTLEEINEDIRRDRERYYETDMSIGIAKKSIEQKEKSIRLIERASICPTCGQSLKGDECKKACEIWRLEIKKLKLDMERDENIMRSIDVVERSKKIDISDIEKEVKYLMDIQEEIKLLQAELSSDPSNEYISRKEPLERNKDRYERAAGTLYLAMTKINDNISISESRINVLGEKEIEVQAELFDIQEGEERVRLLEEKVESEKENKERLEKTINRDEEIVEGLKKGNEEIRKKRIRYEEMIDYLNHIKTLCKDEHVKQYAISTIIPFLNKKTNEYLSNVGFPFYIIIDKWLEIDVKGPGITKGSYGSLSGGEGRSIDLALQLAFFDVARVQAGVWPDVVVFDELLDSSVDNLGINELLEIITLKQSEDEGSKIFIISHRPEIGDEFEADNKYWVTKRDGYSSVEMK